MKLIKGNANMGTPIITWLAIITLFIVIISARLVAQAIRHSGKKSIMHHRFIEIGKEHEVFYCPGDPLRKDLGDEENWY